MILTEKGQIEKATVFVSGTGGITCYRIPALARTAKGTLIAFCEARKRSCGDWGHSAIMARRCADPVDHLAEWSPPSVVHESDRLVDPVGLEELVGSAALADEKGWDQDAPDYEPRVDVCTDNPLVIVDRDGKTIHLVYCEHYDAMFYTRSTDDGITWAKPKDLASAVSTFKDDYDFTIIASGPGHGLQILHGHHAGRLVVPIWLASNKADPRSHHPSQVAVIFSDDGGDTWERGDFIPFEEYSPSEAQAIQLDDGRVLLNCRHVPTPDASEPPRRIYTTSRDGAHAWDKFQNDTTLPEPVCLGSIVKLVHPGGRGKGLVVFSNPDGDAAKRERRRLTAHASPDDCRTWPWKRVIEAGAAAYSDLAVDDRDGWIYCLYEDGSIPGRLGPYNGLTVARFDVEWLAGGSKKTL